MSTQTEKSRYIAIAAEQLIAICRDSKTLGFSDAEDARIRAIGFDLNRRGGWNAMSDAHEIVDKTLGKLIAYDVERSWHGIGNWLL
jgi:hypothetical protein